MNIYEYIVIENIKMFGSMETEIKRGEYRNNFIINTETKFKNINVTSKIETITIILNSNTTKTIEYFKDIYDTVALNFANCEYVGGGVEDGAKAQEEDICRSAPMLYNSLQFLSDGKKRYNRYRYIDWGIWNKQIIFTPNVLFRRNSEYKFYKTPIASSIITSAAPNFSGFSFNGIGFTNYRGTKTTNEKVVRESLISMMKYIYYAPFLAKMTKYKIPDDKTKHDDINLDNMALLLGPWGCGAFVPADGENLYREFMAEQFAYVLQNVNNVYKKVCFTFLKNDKNFEIYQSVLSKYFKLEIITF